MILKNFNQLKIQKYETLLQVKNLKVYYPIYGGILKHKVGEIKAVNGVSFTIKSGETLGLVGESGCGKSTIAKSLLELIPKEDGEIFLRRRNYQKFLMLNYDKNTTCFSRS